MCKLTKQTLAQHVCAIRKSEETAKQNTFEIAVRLNIINYENLWDDLTEDYTSMVDFAAKTFGYAKSTTLNYIKLADKFLTVTTNEKGKTEIRTICAHTETDENGKEHVYDYGIGQLNAVGKLSADYFKIADEGHVINPHMSVTEIKTAIKNWLEPDSGSAIDVLKKMVKQDHDDTSDNTDGNRPDFDYDKCKVILQPFIDAYIRDNTDIVFFRGIMFGMNSLCSVSGFGITIVEPFDNDYMKIQVTDIAANDARIVELFNMKTGTTIFTFGGVE